MVATVASAPALNPLIERRYTPPPLPLSARTIGQGLPLSKVQTDIACALDRARLSQRVGIAPDSWQADLLRSEARQVMLNCARQVGKSTTTATLAAHTAIYCPGEPILLLSPTLRQSGLLFARVKWVLKRLGSDFAEPETDNAVSVCLSNGSQVYSLPGNPTTVRGFSGARLVIVDEAAFIDDDLMTSISPMLAVSGGRLVLLSTPFGKRGFFYREWTDGGEAWERFTVRAEDCPRIPADYRAEERRKLGIFYEQECGCQFLDSTNALFYSADIDAMLSSEVAPLFPISLLTAWEAPCPRTMAHRTPSLAGHAPIAGALNARPRPRQAGRPQRAGDRRGAPRASGRAVQYVHHHPCLG